MNDYTEPFCIVGSKGKFANCYTNYLPPIDPRPAQEELEAYLYSNNSISNSISTSNSISNSIIKGRGGDTDKDIERLKIQVSYLISKLDTHIEKSKKQRYRYE
jgi:hypothetical protein|tara:strand:+ start:97 stop:405 length:309 start_codon:yes stop_codon:yes gene_type:complete